jgi:hypothetical protein
MNLHSRQYRLLAIVFVLLAGPLEPLKLRLQPFEIVVLEAMPAR